MHQPSFAPFMEMKKKKTTSHSIFLFQYNESSLKKEWIDLSEISD